MILVSIPQKDNEPAQVEYPAGAGFEIIEGSLLIVDSSQYGLAVFAPGTWLVAEIKRERDG